MFEWWWEFLYNISHAINQCLDALFKLFLWFSGASDADINGEFTGDAAANPLKSIFSTNTVAIWFAGILGLAVFVFLISIIIAIVRTEITGKDNKEGKVKIFKSCIKGTLLVVLLPLIFGIAIRAVTILLNGLTAAMSTDGNNSFAQELFNICMPDQTSGNTYPWDSSYAQINAWLGENGSMHDYNYFIAFVGGIVMLFILGLAVLNLIERIIDLVFLYIISPVVIAVSPLDEGNRLGIWKDLTIAKFLSIAGMLMCFYIYFLFMGIINSLLVGSGFLIGFTKLICAIGGALAARKGGLLISNLVGHNTAMIESQQQGVAAQTVGTGFRAGLGVVGMLGHSAIHLLGGAGKLVGGAISHAGTGLADSSAGAAAPGAGAGSGAGGVATTFSALSALYAQSSEVSSQSTTLPLSISTPNTVPVGEQATSVSSSSFTMPGMDYGGNQLTTPGASDYTNISEGTAGSGDLRTMMPPVSGNIQNIINSAEGLGGVGSSDKPEQK